MFFDNVRVPAENLVGEENAGMELRQVPALQRAQRCRSRVGQQNPSGTGEGDRRVDPSPNGSLLEDPLRGRMVELENDLLALELTQLRVVASDGDGKPNPVSSVLKLRGSELTQAVTELMTDLAGPTH